MSAIRHFRCLGCSAHGSATIREALRIIVRRHLALGHSVEYWERGHRPDALVLRRAPVVDGVAVEVVSGPTRLADELIR
jgi:hypothetical protein